MKFREITTTTTTTSTEIEPGSGQPKYTGPAGQKSRMFNVLAFRESEHRIAICEGELDAITLHHGVGIPAVGISGAQAWKGWYGRAFDGYEDVQIWADHDANGAGMALARLVMEQVPHARLIHLPLGVDVNDLYCRDGRQAVLDLSS